MAWGACSALGVQITMASTSRAATRSSRFACCRFDVELLGEASPALVPVACDRGHGGAEGMGRGRMDPGDRADRPQTQIEIVTSSSAVQPLRAPKVTPCMK